MKKPAKQKDENVRYCVREIAKPTNVVMEGQKVHCDKYRDRSNVVMTYEAFESVPM